MWDAGAANGMSGGDAPSNGLRCTTACESAPTAVETSVLGADAMWRSRSAGPVAEGEGAWCDLAVEALAVSGTGDCRVVGDPPFRSATCIGPVCKALVATGGLPISARNGLGWT